MTDAPAERTFSPTDAALEGFRLTRENPRLFLPWLIGYAIVTFITTALMITYAGDTLMALRAAEEAGNADPVFAAQALARLLPFSLLGILLMSVIGAAIFRLILRPEDNRYAYLRLGADELRQFLLTLMFLALWILATFVVVLALSIVAAIIGGIVTAAAPGGAGAVIALLAMIAGFSVFPVTIWLLVRFSLAWPMTFAEQRIRLFQSWRVTKGHFWPLLGAYVLAAILAFIVFLLGLLIYAGVAGILTGGDIAGVGAVFSPDMSSVEAYFTAPMMIYTITSGLLVPLQYLIAFAPVAIAYREFMREGQG